MKAHEVMAAAIPKLESGRVARMMSISADYVRRWRREPKADSASASGQRSVLDRLCDLLDAIHCVNPKGTGLVVQHVNAHFNKLIGRKAAPFAGPAEIAAAGASLLKEATEAINKLHIEGCTPHTLRELVELRDTADSIINSVEQTMSQEDQAEVR